MYSASGMLCTVRRAGLDCPVELNYIRRCGYYGGNFRGIYGELEGRGD